MGKAVAIDVLLRHDAVQVPREALVASTKDLAFQMITEFSPGKRIPFGHVGELRPCVLSIKIDDTLKECVPAESVEHVDVRVVRVVDDVAYVENVDEGLFEEAGGDETGACEVLPLPNASLVGLWESLCYDDDADAADAAADALQHLSISPSAPARNSTTPHPQWCGALKAKLLDYCSTSLLFSDAGVDPNVVGWNKVVLFHGPPGTGKTSLCKALAQRLAVAMSDRYRSSQLVEINTHSLFSKWFSESGKMVMKLFTRVREMAADPACLVVLLVDEVESLAAARKAALNSSEPSDSIRVVNALLTQLDALRRFPNVLTLCTSNITEAIDLAFVDRADLKIFIGNPGARARYSMLAAAVNELIAKRLLHGQPVGDGNTCGEEFGSLMARLDGSSGRFLKKLPFLAFTALPQKRNVSVADFVGALHTAAADELDAKAKLASMP
eukprot:TRINITY_DN14392_c0_g1_i1.p1 TRINITY_DN14392_c0_g1~~TRINITY_DN14392_c0_g1_i1.p1  ORF type:complete len:442 (+),score=154.72 TRINITY_DN14392_c0_g1_i1:33-1358(+)